MGHRNKQYSVFVPTRSYLWIASGISRHNGILFANACVMILPLTFETSCCALAIACNAWFLETNKTPPLFEKLSTILSLLIFKRIKVKMKWKMIPAMKSSLKATHAIKGNSKEVSQPGERLPEHQEGWRQEPRPCWATKTGTADRKRKYIYALSGHERIEKRSDQWSCCWQSIQILRSIPGGNARVPGGKTS